LKSVAKQHFSNLLLRLPKQKGDEARSTSSPFCFGDVDRYNIQKYIELIHVDRI
jgi:hypothetical protein